ncbi:hypothetical protein LTR47_006963 [Exophiala xenobiotica]|nr:hypothetical protein LTR41_002032 [Exophiala xenobiotica]KAK5231830.1 hypothetical protein LTR47_006963 [Exophiala xenobiotica]KAK5246075.1 hypothetical protein LTS06_008591 [Exophiala xenobiotica]KAK5283227.1 hypothetical protein LTR40_002065 [Exophiala xenobiotica]KAK5353646.1 hypothetical protein LTR61_002340 [Exophiala xenobiotica]
MPYNDLPRMSSIRLGGLLGHDDILELTLGRSNEYAINECDEDGRTALLWASKGGHEKVVRILLDHGADVNAEGGQYGNALQAALKGGHEKMVLMLVDRGADVNAEGGNNGLGSLQEAAEI